MRERRRFHPTTYIVVWREESIVKAGSTCYVGGYPRWRQFIARGAEVVHLFSDPPGSGLNIEKSMRQALAHYGRRAFTDKYAAATYLGSGGSGYSECFLVPPAMLEHVLEHVLPGIARRVGASNATYVTDATGRDEELPNRMGHSDYLLTPSVQVSNSTPASQRACARDQHGEAQSE